MGRWIWRIVLAAALLLVGWVVWRAAFHTDPVPVTVVEVARGQVEETVTNSRAGTVRARRRARLSPEIGGRVVALPHREGERVAAGDVLLAVEDDIYRDRLRLAERDLEVAEAERDRLCLAAERAGRELARTRKLAEDGIVSTDLLDQVESGAVTAAAACQAAEAGVSRAGAAVTAATTELAKTVLRAPFPGVVAELTIELGEWTTPSPPALPVPPVLDLIDTSSIYISAPMDEVDSARISPGQRARVSVDSYRDRSFPGTVTRVAPYVLDVQEQNRTVEIEVALDDADFAANLLPGTSADVEVILAVEPDALRIPTSTLLGGDRVLVVEDGRLAERPLTTGLRNWDFTEVREGLAAGELVVTSLDRPEVKAGAPAAVEGSDGAEAGG